MTNRDLAEKIYEDLNKRGALLGNAMIGIICKTLDDNGVKNCSIPNVSTRTEMRKQAINVFELTKGFTGEPTDNAMKTALEMADYVMRLTNDL